MVVGLRACVCLVQHGTQVQHRHHASQNRCFHETQDNHLDRCDRARSLWLSLLPALRHAMSAIFLFLDSLHRRERHLHQSRDYGQCNLCILCYLMCSRLDTWTSANLPRLEFEDEPQDETLGCNNFGTGCHVSIPVSPFLAKYRTHDTPELPPQRSFAFHTSKISLTKKTSYMLQQTLQSGQRAKQESVLRPRQSPPSVLSSVPSIREASYSAAVPRRALRIRGLYLATQAMSVAEAKAASKNLA